MSAQSRRLEYLRCIECKAEEYDRQGYSVKANISGWSLPPTIDGFIPDIRAKRGESIIIGKVVRKEDLNSVEKDYKKLIDYAEKNSNTSFRIYRSSENGKPTLHKIF